MYAHCKNNDHVHSNTLYSKYILCDLIVLKTIFLYVSADISTIESKWQK